VVKYLIKKGVDVNQADKNGITPLFLASANNFMKIIKILIKKKAVINKAMKKGITPLYLACQEGHLEVVEYLIKKGAELDKATNKGKTPLHIASKYGSSETVDFLISRGAEINKVMHDGRTALYIASSKNRFEVAKLLIARGADINKARRDGSTPLKAAIISGSVDIAKFLIENGANRTLDVGLDTFLESHVIQDEERYQTEEYCFICYKGFEWDEKNMIHGLPNCEKEHCLCHKACIEKWLLSKRECPFCRKSVTWDGMLAEDEFDDSEDSGLCSDVSSVNSELNENRNFELNGINDFE
jgi:ankyrin repeat protein